MGDMGIEPIGQLLDIASIRQVRTLLADSPDAMILIGDAEGTVLWASRPGTDDAGREPSSLIGRPVFDYVHPDDREHVRRTWARAASGETVQYTYRASSMAGGWGTATTVAWGEPGQSGPVVVTISSAIGTKDDGPESNHRPKGPGRGAEGP